jgi:hypothetical protein
MRDLFHFAVEAHGGAATLYMSGAPSVADALRALRLCLQLPLGVRALRVDVRGVEFPNHDVLVALTIALYRWSLSRGGSIRMALPTRPRT